MQNTNAQNVVESQLAEHSMEQTSTLQPQTIKHSTQTENNSGTHGQQAGRISPVTPPRPAMIRETSKAEHATAEHTSAQVHSNREQKTVNHVQNQATTKSAPIMPNTSQSSHTTSTPVPVQAPRNTVSASDYSVTPAVVPKNVSPAKQEHTHPSTPARIVKPNVTPQRNRGVSAAVRPDISPVAAQNPTVKPQQNRGKSPNPTSPVSPAAQPHTMRRTAEPVKRKGITPGNGDDRNARRKRKRKP